MGWTWFLIIGALAGWLAGLLTRGGGFGIVGDVAVGVAGGVIGGLLADELGVESYGFVGSLLTSTVGALVMLSLIRVIRKA